MTVDDIDAQVERIRRAIDVDDDNEAAHSAEDDLWRAVLEAIAKGNHHQDPALLAIRALATTDIEFTRWHA